MRDVSLLCEQRRWVLDVRQRLERRAALPLRLERKSQIAVQSNLSTDSVLAARFAKCVTGEAERLPHSDVALLRIRFQAGSRTHWHTHENAQIYLVEEGRGRVQIQGQEILDVGPGEPVYMPPMCPTGMGRLRTKQRRVCTHALAAWP